MTPHPVTDDGSTDEDGALHELSQCPPMIPDIDVYRTANILVKQHGDEAPIHAA